MCGICGIVDLRGNGRLDASVIGAMVRTLAHRGPDDHGIQVWDGQGLPRVGLGHARLSIIDLSPRGHQPMRNEDGSVWLVQNGEIFNFELLRAELEARGHRFYSRTDSEVIVHAYEEYGERCVERLRGQFSFAIWDSARRRLFLARDHVGIKPLYYCWRDGRFIFGSEIKAILAAPGVERAIDPVALSEFLAFEFIPSPRTMLKNIQKLPPGHCLSLADGSVRMRSYWEPRYAPVAGGEEELCERLVSLLRDAVKSQMVSDVPLGAFLSGGLDSSTVVALMAQAAPGKIKTYSIGFEDQSYNELAYAREVAARFGAQHEEFVITPRAVDLVEKIVCHLDDPIADFSVFPTYLVSAMARQYVTVALTGDGGDEIFAGYDTYVAQKLATQWGGAARLLGRRPLSSLISRLPPSAKKKGAVNRLKRFSEGLVLPAGLRHYRWMVFMPEAEQGGFFTDDFLGALAGASPYASIMRHFDRVEDADGLNAQLYVDLKTYLTDNCLLKVDRMSMASSLEVRVPLLDHPVVEFMAAVPPTMKMKGFQRKYILRKAFSRLLPEKILGRGKEGFSIPMKNWLRAELRPMMTDLLAEGSVKRRGYFRPEAVRQLIREHLGGRENHSHRLWSMMLFELWARRFVD